MELRQPCAHLLYSLVQPPELLRIELLRHELAEPLARALLHHDEVRQPISLRADAAKDLHREGHEGVLGDLRVVLGDAHEVLRLRKDAAGRSLAPALLQHQLLAISNDPDALIQAALEAAHLLFTQRA